MIQHSKTFLDKEESLVVNRIINNGLLTVGEENKKISSRIWPIY